MGIIAKYKFNQNVYENFIPEFNSEFTDYTITDEIDTDGYTIRTIESDDLPTLMRFGQLWVGGENGATDKSLSLLEVLECDTSSVTSMNSMFRYCSSLISLDVSNFNTENVTDMHAMFANCSSLTSLDVSNFNVENVTSMDYMFYNCSLLTSLDVSNFKTEKVTDMYGMFYNCSSLTSLNLSNLSTENVTNTQEMFRDCSSLTSLNLSNFNTEKVTTMREMFRNCSSLTSLDISNFNTEKVNTMQYMFQNCSSLTSLDLSNFNTSNVTNMIDMFSRCSLLTSLDVSNFDTGQVISMQGMFYNCSSLVSLDLSDFNTSDVTNMYALFSDCSSLTSLDISNFNTEKVSNTSNVFTNCPKLIDMGAIYCNSSTINTLSSLIATNTTIWYMDANLSDLTQLDNITYKKYQTTTLSLNEPIQLRSIGDVHDEINYETGEYIQRIGEVVLDGNEDWTYADNTDGTKRFTLPISDFKDYGISSNGKNLINNKLPKASFSTYGNTYGVSTWCNYVVFFTEHTSVNDFKQWLSQNPITVQYELAEPIITKIDTTILDQNNSYKSSQQTYDESTYVSVQSDTVVTPSSSIDYEIYSSTGTITGTSASIDNAEAGTPIEAVVYGETLLNVAEDVYIIQEGVTATIEKDKTYKQIYLKGVSSNTQTVVNPSVVIMSSPFIFGKGGRL